MSEAEATKKIRRIQIDAEVLSQLDQKEQAFLITVCHAVSEINTFGRLGFYSATKEQAEPVLKAAQIHQNLAIIRCLSAKLFELVKLFKDRRYGSSNGKISTIYDYANECSVGRELDTSLASARNIRDFVTNHYDPKRVEKNLAHLADGMDLDLYLTQPEANSFTMMGDEVSFTGQFNREFSSRKLSDGESGLGFWWHWTLEAWRWSREVHNKTVEVLLFDSVVDLRWDDLEVSIPQELIAQTGFTMPIFIAETQT